MRFLIVFLLSLLAMRPGITEDVTSHDRFELWTNCQPLQLHVYLQDEENEIDLTNEDIEIAVRSRLRSARLYTDEFGTPTLNVNISVFGPAFDIEINLYKFVSDSFHSKEDWIAITWSSNAIGTHGQNGNYILQSVSQYIDRFIDAYLRVNADSC